jgi:hypothetical protein
LILSHQQNGAEFAIMFKELRKYIEREHLMDQTMEMMFQVNTGDSDFSDSEDSEASEFESDDTRCVLLHLLLLAADNDCRFIVPYLFYRVYFLCGHRRTGRQVVGELKTRDNL